MNKIILFLISISMLLFLWCSIVRNNPLDEKGSDYVPPTITIDTLQSTISKGDTIHFDSIAVVLIGNTTQSRFREKLDTAQWNSWQSPGIVKLNNIGNGRHVLYIETKNSGGALVFDDSIAFVVNVVYPIQTTDTTKPSIKLVDPSKDSAIINTPSERISLKIKDTAGISRVRIFIGPDTLPVSKANDSTWTANLANLQSGVYTKVIVDAWDASDRKNTSAFTFYIEYIPNNTTGPIIKKVSGLVTGTQITDPNVTLIYSIVDTNGIDSVYWTLNGTVSGVLTPNTKNQYSINAALARYHLDCDTSFRQILKP